MELSMTFVDHDLEALIVENINKKFPNASVDVRWSLDSEYVMAHVTVKADL